jgi:hypothetical protein
MVTAERVKVQIQMDATRFAETKLEYDTLKNKKKRMPAWHALFGGPESIADLAVSVGRASLYEYFYRIFSAEVHSTSALNSIKTCSQTNQAALRPLRYPLGAPASMTLCGSILVDLYRELVDRSVRIGDKSFRHGIAGQFKRTSTS